MQVKLYASLRQAAGTKMMDVNVQPGTTIRQVLAEVTQRFPILAKFIWERDGELSEHAHVFINSENIHHSKGLDTPVKTEDHVDIFPPLVGGQKCRIGRSVIPAGCSLLKAQLKPAD
jgi:molybdopterin synthase sulfur carrier subunit